MKTRIWLPHYFFLPLIGALLYCLGCSSNKTQKENPNAPCTISAPQNATAPGGCPESPKSVTEEVLQITNETNKPQGVPSAPLNGSNSDKDTTSIGYGVTDKNAEIAIIGRPSVEILGDHLKLWPLKIDDFSFRLDETGGTPNGLEQVIQDFGDCGFSYSGPSCYEGQEISILRQDLIAMGSKQYVYTVFSYSSSYNGIYALYLELSDKKTNAEKNLQAFLYTILDPNSSFSPQNIAAEIDAVCISKINYGYINADNIDVFEKNATNIRQTLSLLEAKLFFPQNIKSEAVLKQIKNRLQETLPQVEESLKQTNDPNIAFLWLDLQKWLFTEPGYQEFLLKQLQSPRSSIATESALKLVGLNIINELIDKKYAAAISAEHLGEQYRAFTLARENLGISPRVLLGLINTLSYPNINSAETAFKILDARVLGDNYVEKLARLTSRIGQNGNTYVYAIDLLAKIKTVNAQNALIAELSNKTSDIRQKIIATLRNLDFTPASIQAASEHMESPKEDSREAAARILDNIDTPEATLVLIKYMDQDSYNMRRFINDTLLRNPLKSFTDLHLEELIKKLDSPYPEQVLSPAIDCLFRLGSPEAVLSLLKFYIKRNNKLLPEVAPLRKTMVERFSAVTFTEIHAQELGTAAVEGNKDYRHQFLFHLISVKHYVATEVILKLLISNRSQIVAFLNEVKQELLLRKQTDMSLFDGDCGYLTGDLYINGEANISTIDKIRVRPVSNDEIAAKKYYQELGPFSFDLLLSIKTASALKAKIILMGIQDAEKRLKIIADIENFTEEIPTDYYWYIGRHIKNVKESSGCYTNCGPSLSSAQEMFVTIPSPFDETRDMSIKLLKRIYFNPKSFNPEKPHWSDREGILLLFRGNFYLSLNIGWSDPVISEELFPDISEKSINFFKNVLSAAPELFPEAVASPTLTMIAPSGSLCPSDKMKEQEVLDKIRLLEIWPYLPNPASIMDHMYSFFNRCPQAYHKYPLLEDAVIHTLSKMEPEVFKQEISLAKDQDEKNNIILAYLAWTAPLTPDPGDRCQYLAENAYIDPLRTTILGGIADLEKQLGSSQAQDWFLEVINDCPNLTTTNPELSRFLSLLIPSVPQ